MSNITKIRPVGVNLFHTDRRTDMKKLIFTFRNFANSPKIWNSLQMLYKLWNNVMAFVSTNWGKPWIPHSSVRKCTDQHSSWEPVEYTSSDLPWCHRAPCAVCACAVPVLKRYDKQLTLPIEQRNVLKTAFRNNLKVFLSAQGLTEMLGWYICL